MIRKRAGVVAESMREMLYHDGASLLAGRTDRHFMMPGQEEPELEDQNEHDDQLEQVRLRHRVCSTANR